MDKISKRVFLIDGCRSPIGRGDPQKGVFRNLRADELAVRIMKALLRRNSINPSMINDFYLGCVGQHLEQGKNLARLILLLAEMPETIPGVTINRLCASSLTALQMARDSILAGSNDVMLVGGVEHLGHVPMTAALDYHPKLFSKYDFQWSNMGLTAELLAADFHINRVEQDEFTYESNRRYFAARESGFFRREIIPVILPDGSTIEEDQEPRLSEPSALSNLRTVFKENGTVTAANSSGISDGACMALIAGESSLKKLSLSPLAEIKSTVTVGVKPQLMGLGPVPAIRKLLEKTRLTIDDVDIFEINEAFAVQLLASQRELGIDPAKLNIHGGAVALGHPLGMTGLRIAVTLAHSMSAAKAKRGIAALCVGHGQGVAMLMENAS